MKLSKPVLWTWDHSTNWKINSPGKQNMGASNFYQKHSDQFIDDYTRAIRFAADNGIEAIFIAGLLRDNHGGVEAARKLAILGRETGVRICGIVGLLAYGGIYYEGDNPWSLDKFLKQNPECLAVNDKGQPLVTGFGNVMPKKVRHACGSNPKVRDFVLRSVEWLFKTIPDLGGLQFETGDTGVCQCSACRKRYSSNAKTISYDDMAVLYPQVSEIILASGDAWAVCETYAHFLSRRTQVEPTFACGLPDYAPAMLAKVPKQAFFQWVADGFIEPCDPAYSFVAKDGKDPEWQEGEPVPAPLEGYRHIMRAHFGTFWTGAMRHRLAVDKIQRMCRLSASSRLHCISLFGEGSAFHANAEFNYLAGSYFSSHTEAGMETFVDEIMGTRLGGANAARDYVEWNRKASLTENEFAQLASHAARSNGDVRRRWLWLCNYLESLRWDKTA